MRQRAFLEIVAARDQAETEQLAVFFGELPDAVAFAGMALIVLSGLFTFLREEQLYGWSRRTWLMRNGP